ncbi:MAG: restriction endonuclease subunit S [Lewinellaceae bacterium]|nr:restriction endonuclease subunit S [Lewinellaceae bacterium]
MREWQNTELGLIPSDWKIVSFRELLCEKVRNGVYKPAEYHGKGCKIVNMGELFAFPRLKSSEQMQLIELTEDELKKFSLQKGDLIFARRSLIMEGAGKCSLIYDVKEPLTFESSIIRARPNREKADPIFLFHFFNSRIGRYLLGTIMRVTAVAGITGTDLMELNLPLPSLPQQKSIAHLLDTFDRKISLLHRQNRTLEAMARTLFKRWFIDFEFPDAQGRPYRSSGGKMVEGEMGEMPEGWGVGKILNLARIKKMSISPTQYPKKEFCHYSIPAYDEGQTPKRELGAQILSSKFIVEKHSILVSKLNPSISRIWDIHEVDETFSICSTEFQVFIPRKELLFPFLFFLFKARYVAKEMAQRATGTSGSHQRIRPDDILDIDIMIPAEDLILKYSEAAGDLLKKKCSNLNKIQTLTALRDTLLPKLMNGELRVRDVEI